MSASSYDQTASAKLDAFIQSPAPILAIETSCDETAAAVVLGRKVLSSAVHSQIPLHRKYGGVVPEIASRDHVRRLPEVVALALNDSGLLYDDIGVIAVTARPGLVGALLTGVSYAKGLAYALGIPLIGVNHVMGHIAANYITHLDLVPPFTCLVASGGHSHIYMVESYTKLRLIGSTRDDAAGEAFDKVARALSLPYPGGPALEALAGSGNAEMYTFHSAFNAGDSLDFSFSGLKTAVINLLHTAEQRGEIINKADAAASFQRTLIDTLSRKAVLAAKSEGSGILALCGGVSANRELVSRMGSAANENGLKFISPVLKYCGDNAAMIGCAGYYALLSGERDGLGLNASAR